MCFSTAMLLPTSKQRPCKTGRASRIERVRRMETEKIITGYRATIDHVKVGYPIKALTHMYTSFNNPDLSILGEIDAIPEVLRRWSITGDSHYCIEVVARSIEDLRRVLTELAKLGKLSTCVALSWRDKGTTPVEVDNSEREMYNP